MEKKRWILLANRSHAKIFEYDEDNGLRLLQEFEHPIGRLKNRELTSDRQSRTWSEGTGKFAVYSDKTEPKEQLALEFVKELTQVLKKGYENRDYDSLAVIAEPHFLGHLKKDLPVDPSSFKVQFLNKEITHLKGRKLLEKLKQHKIVN